MGTVKKGEKNMIRLAFLIKLNNLFFALCPSTPLTISFCVGSGCGASSPPFQVLLARLCRFLFRNELNVFCYKTSIERMQLHP